MVNWFWVLWLIVGTPYNNRNASPEKKRGFLYLWDNLNTQHNFFYEATIWFNFMHDKQSGCSAPHSSSFQESTLHIYIRPYKYNEYHHTFACYCLHSWCNNILMEHNISRSFVLSLHQQYNLFLLKCDVVESVFMRLIDNLLRR